MSRALSDEEAGKEMKKMVAFIMQEANEKAKEIKIKADEEFNIEKAKLVRQETTSIEANFTRRLAQADVKRKIAQSNQINKSRLTILQHKDELFDSIVLDAKQKLPELKSNVDELMEDDVIFECIAEDVKIVEDAMLKAKAEYCNQTGRTVAVEIRPILDPMNIGGVVGVTKNGKIRCSNTFRDRLQSFSELSMPKIHQVLFGVSESRKHLN